jgi:hypothetical protein
MKLKYLLIITLVFMVKTMFSQGKLYVYYSEPNFDVPYDQYNGHDQITRHSYSYTKTHTSGVYDITTPTIDIKFTYSESYEVDEDNYSCSGPCGYGANHNDSSSFNLSYYNVRNHGYSGPTPITLPIDIISPNDYPASYSAIYLPNMIPITTTPSYIAPLFDSHFDERGDPHDVQGALTWLYFNPLTDTWKVLPNFKNTFPLDKSVRQIFGQNYKDYLVNETTLQLKFDIFRGDYNGGNYTFTVIEPSPQLLSFTSVDSKCSYSDDGSFSMILDRDLEENKKLVVSLFYEFVKGSNSYSLLDQKDVEILIDNRNGTFTYNWTNGTSILPGNYKVKYQTYNKNTTTPYPLWDSLEGTEEGFNIGAPPKITFLATKIDNISCKDLSDGSIQLNITGGVGNYEYELNNNDVWLPFSNTNTGTQGLPTKHVINNLSSGKKIIKIRDRNKCSARQ